MRKVYGGMSTGAPDLCEFPSHSLWPTNMMTDIITLMGEGGNVVCSPPQKIIALKFPMTSSEEMTRVARI